MSSKELSNRILIIDDDMYIRNACLEFLQSEDYDVMAAESGEEGIDILKDRQFEIVISDLKLPEMDGLEVLKKIKETWPAIDVIIITAHGTIENAVQAMKLGAYDYLPKTFDLAELDLVIKRCLEKQRLSAEISELKELVNLYEVSKAISSIMNLDELLQLILKLASDTLSADGGSIMLYSPETDELTVKAALGPRKDEILNKSLKCGERISGFAAKNIKPLAIQGELTNDPRFADLEQFDNLKSAMTVPLSRKGRLLGVVNLNRRENKPDFTQHDLNLLSIFAVEAAVAIENTYLFNSLEQEKDELNATFASMADGVIVTDAGLNILRVNNSAERFLCVSPSDSVGRNLPEIIPDFEPSISWDDIKKLKNLTVSFELTRQKGKSLLLGVHATTIKDQENNSIGKLMVFRDITEERKQEKQKMDFLALISHKLRTPLTSINGFSTLLLDKSQELDDKTRMALRSINKQGNLLALLVDKLLRFTLLESEYTELHQEKVNLNVMIERCLKGLVGCIEKNNAILTVAPGIHDLPSLNVDALKIIEVIENFIENAIKFNDKERKTVVIDGRVLDANFVIVNISDNGRGIPSEETQKIFQKFYQIDEYFTGEVEGVGLGLAVVKKIVELHGGKITIESKINEGSKFSMTFPIWKNK